jgi:hypothetical protein
MPDLNSFATPTTLPGQNPLLSELLLAECHYDLNEISSVIEPLLDAPKRCRRTGSYIQAVTTRQTGFLATNLINNQLAEVTPISSSWLIGRSIGCAIQVQQRTVSRRHAVIGHYPLGFYIADLGSLNGTWVNQCRIEPAQRILLEDGDLLQFGMIKVEFFLAKQELALVCTDETDSFRSKRD